MSKIILEKDFQSKYTPMALKNSIEKKVYNNPKKYGSEIAKKTINNFKMDRKQ